jgi:hypothetical protein
VNVYNNLGFLCNGYTIEETNHGWKNETRDATSIEVDFWERSERNTPEIPVIQVSDNIDLYDSLVNIPFKDFEDQACDGRVIWLENKYEKVLCSKTEYASWGVQYREFKQIRSV